MSGDADPGMRNAPIYIIGICQRSGTNFLSELLRLHPDCGTPDPIHEDFIVSRSDLLVRYVRKVVESWGPDWGITKAHATSLMRHLGDGALAFLQSHTDRPRLVTKTPNPNNIGNISFLLPEVHLLILVRDGRDVVESTMRGFGTDFESALDNWVNGAELITRFQRERGPARMSHLLLRYEDLVRDTEAEIARVFAAVALDPAAYDFEAAKNLPVYGSSTDRGGDEAEVHWRPVAKTPDFQPIGRWAEWDEKRRRAFKARAAELMAALNYDLGPDF